MEDELMGAKEVSDFLRVSKSNLWNIRQRKSDFPKPVVVLARGPIWKKKDIEEWKKQRGKG